MRKVIISLAPVEAGKPVDREALAEDVKKGVEAGAAMCHLHCRQPDGALTPDITELSRTFDRIREKTDVVVQVSTGGVSLMSIKERCRPLNYPWTESASLNGGTTNLGEAVYINSLEDIRYCAKAVYEREILPEIEVFDIGMIYSIQEMQKGLPWRTPLLFNLVFGHGGGMQPDIRSLHAFWDAVPREALWGVTHYGRDNWTFLAAAIAMGASIVRIGFEDSPYLKEGQQAVENWQLVEKLAELIRAMGLEPATPEEARKMLQLVPKGQG